MNLLSIIISLSYLEYSLRAILFQVLVHFSAHGIVVFVCLITKTEYLGQEKKKKEIKR